MRKLSASLFAFGAAMTIAMPPAGAQNQAPARNGTQEAPPPRLSNAPGSNAVRTSPPTARAECRPASENCPTDSSGDSVVSTDSQPLGSTVKRGNGPTVDESDYPTSVGTGGSGSGVTGTPTGPDSGPTLGTGR